MVQQADIALTRWLRWALTRFARARPRARDMDGAERRVTFLLATAWGMGGTIRTTLNLAGYLASHGYEVQIASATRREDDPFFGGFPDGVDVTALDDERPGMEPSWWHPLRRAIRRRPSVLMHPEDKAARAFNLWVDWRLVRLLRRRCGFLVTTRPGLNLIAAQLSPPGLVLVGQEHMHLRQHPEGLRKAARHHYGKLDVLAVLTERDRERYARFLRAQMPIVRVPNTTRDLGGVRADPGAKTVLAAGRFVKQKGYDRLVRAWARVAPEHADWRLRICGDGPMRPRLERFVAERQLEGSVSIEGPAADLPAEMSKASVFVLSSRWEGMPLVLLEAMSAGMTVVSFDCPTGPADVIDDHRNGLLIRPRTLDALAAGLREVIEDEQLRRRCSAAAVETAAEYAIEVVGPRWAALLRDAWEARAS